MRARLEQNLWSAMKIPRRVARIAIHSISHVVAGGRYALRAPRVAFSVLWHRLAAWRHLLSARPEQLTIAQRAKRQVLQAFLASPDFRYHRCFARFDRMRERSPEEHHRDFSNGILMMIGTLGPGGAERQLVATAKALRTREKLDVDVTVACSNLTTPAHRFFQTDLEAANIEVTLIGSERKAEMPHELRAFLCSLPSELHDIGRYAATFWARKPQIAHLWLDEINTKGGLAAVLTGVPKIIVSQRSLPPTNFTFHQPYMREAYRWLAQHPTVTMINNSEAGARSYETWLGLPHGAINVVRNGYAFSDQEIASHWAARGRYREQIGIPPVAPIVGAVMRLSEEKQPHMWLEIAALVRADVPDAHFLIVGDGPLRGSLEKRALQPDLDGSVHFIGHLRDALDAIADMDLLLLTSRAEGLPNVLVEAQFLGVPVVATPVGGAPEAIDHGKSGWLLGSGDVHSHAERIVALLENKDWRRAAAEYGPNFVRARFNMQRAIDETLALYGETIVR